MSGRFWVLAAFVSGFALLHCGGSVEVEPNGKAGSSGKAGLAGHAGSTAVGRAGDGGSSSIPLDAAFDEYVDPGCPDSAPPPASNECDPLSSAPTCPFGEGCYPYVEHPFGEGCGVQTFGASCIVSGSGRQGDLCDQGDRDCASGFVCVVGSQPGSRCVQLCLMSVAHSCPAGMICGELDVEGYGVCS
jgi:hypothetical protein